jgi:hypothetical protein
VSKPKVLAAIPCRNTPQAQCEESVHAAIRHCGVAAAIIKPAHAPREWNRNYIIHQWLSQWDEETEWLWFIDDDTVVTADSLQKLLALNKQIAVGVQPLYLYDRVLVNVSAGCPRPSPDDGGGVVWPEWHTWDASRKPFRIGACGFGCVLLHRSAFADADPAKTHHRHYSHETHNQYVSWDQRQNMYSSGRMHWPWFAENYGNVAGEKSQTEDIWFCRRAHDAGVEIWVDPSVLCGHLKTVDLSKFVARSCVRVEAA